MQKVNLDTDFIFFTKINSQRITDLIVKFKMNHRPNCIILEDNRRKPTYLWNGNIRLDRTSKNICERNN